MFPAGAAAADGHFSFTMRPQLNSAPHMVGGILQDCRCVEQMIGYCKGNRGVMLATIHILGGVKDNVSRANG